MSLDCLSNIVISDLFSSELLQTPDEEAQDILHKLN